MRSLESDWACASSRIWRKKGSMDGIALLVALIAAATVSIREFDLPTRDALPHDPAVGPDASLWVTEQKANKLGRLDPKSGRLREYSLPTADSGPHGLVADREGRSGSPRITRGTSGSSIRRADKSSSFRCRSRTPIRTLP